jgi:ABC-type molybdate transport system substrate-binding protein
MERRKQTITSPQNSTSGALRLPLSERAGRARRCSQFAILLGALLIFSACGGNSLAQWGPGGYEGNNTTHSVTNQGGLIILSTPTLQFVMPPLVSAFMKAHHLTVPYVFDFSGSKQVANTANTATDADLLITDDRDAMVNARFLGFTRSVGTVLATDTLSVILPSTNPGHIATLQDLAVPGHRYFGISGSDGLNLHIQRTLESMNLDPTFGIHYSARVYGNLTVNYTDGVAATQAIAQPNPAGDFTIAYHTNYLAVQKQPGGQTIKFLVIPTQFNPPIQILGAIVSHAQNPILAQQLLDFMHSPAASLIWRQYGFQPAS